MLTDSGLRLLRAAAFALGIGCAAATTAAEEWHVKELLAQYNCAWVAEQRKIYTDAELEHKAEELHLPRVVIEAAKRCPR